MSDLRLLAIDLATNQRQFVAPSTGGGGTQLVSTHNAAIALSGHRIVYLNDAGLLDYADCLNPAHADRVLGLTLTAAAAQAPCQVCTFGEVTEPSWSWLAGHLFLGSAGTLQQTPPPTGFLLRLGKATTSTQIFLTLEPPIFR